ncbi:hypothetical protein GCM10010347_31800 [Streptomyces cirratus]|uniref:K(+)-transporting ATPase subunit F n=1 Tax=Streptomyces cirratus TaxID=68187 RepID=A0ABQ3ET27_9ACTN|nr:hypothetical protein GCM10010347_31800 [Streptomyces cirratus]
MRQDLAGVRGRASDGGRVEQGCSPARPRQREKVQMEAEDVVGLVVALPLLGYLVTALIRPEKF